MGLNLEQSRASNHNGGYHGCEWNIVYRTTGSTVQQGLSEHGGYLKMGTKQNWNS